MISTKQIRQLHKLNIRHVGDLIHIEADGGRVWRMDPTVEWLLDYLPRTPPSCDDYLLWPGQTWEVQNMGDTHTVEIMDIASSDNIRVRHWSPVDGTPTKFIMGDTSQVVSYTHLTLPTNQEV